MHLQNAHALVDGPHMECLSHGVIVPKGLHVGSPRLKAVYSIRGVGSELILE